MFLPSGRDIDLGNLELTATPPPYPLSYNQGSALVNVPIMTASSTAGKLTLAQAPALSGNSITLVINNVNGTGDYACNATTGSKITLEARSSSDPLYWESNNAGGDGLIRITAFDLVHQTLSGTFTATLARGTGVIQVTNGTFANLYYSKP